MVSECEAMRLTTIQSCSKVFIDSNIFTYHLSGHSVFGETCREFFKNVERGYYESYVNDVVLSEVLLNFIKSEKFIGVKDELYCSHQGTYT